VHQVCLRISHDDSLGLDLAFMMIYVENSLQEVLVI